MVVRALCSSSFTDMSVNSAILVISTGNIGAKSTNKKKVTGLKKRFLFYEKDSKYCLRLIDNLS